jgi:nitrite reductase (NADH) small subunit
MGREYAIGPLAQIPHGEGRTFEVGGQRMAVFHTRAGEVYAIQADCPHRGGPLADGLTGGTTIICPLHERTFDLRTGAGIGNDECVASYRARLSEDGTVLIEL